MIFDKLLNFKKKSTPINVYNELDFILNNSNYFSFDNEYKYIQIYQTLPEVNYVVNSMAVMLSKIKPILWKLTPSGKKKSIVENHKILDLLTNPNYYQDYNEFIKQLYIYLKVCGNNFLFRPVPVGFNRTSYDTWLESIQLFNLPSWLTVINIDEYFRVNQGYIEKNPIKDYTFNSTRIIQKEDIQLLNDVNVTFENGKFIKGDSRLKSCEKPLNTLIGSYAARNTIINHRGALGILSNESKDSSGHIPLLGKEKQDIQDQYAKYGLKKSDWQIIISNANLKWQQMSLPISELQLFDTQRVDSETIANTFGFDPLLLNANNAKYDNRNGAEKGVYQNTIIPDSKRIFAALNSILRTKENGFELSIDTSEIECLEVDTTDSNNAITEVVLKISSQLKQGYISSETAEYILKDVWNIESNYVQSIIESNQKLDTIQINTIDNGITDTNTVSNQGDTVSN